MSGDERTWWSPSLGQDMTLAIHGHAGRPIVAFPSQEGRHWDFEGFGMVEACSELIEAGRIRIVAVDGIDSQSWTNHGAHPTDRARRHEAYDRYIVDEVVPFIGAEMGWDTAWAVGASMGAYHAANILFRHPDRFDGLVAMSGIYRLRVFIGDHMDEAVYFQSPLAYLPNLEDPWYLDRIRRARLAFVVGRGRWEEDMLRDLDELGPILASKAIPAIVDYWGHDVDHDWPWWRRMLPYYLDRLGV